ncbi:MAG: SMI1/KNR4 family protein [Pseudomonadota bacterium]
MNTVQLQIKILEHRRASDSDILEAEQSFGVKFPEDFKRFIKSYDAAIFQDNSLDGDLDLQLSCLIEICKMIETVKDLERDSIFPAYAIPFGEDSNGNLFYLWMGSVFFWDHEIEEGGDLQVAPSFTDFMQRLMPFDFTAMFGDDGIA